MLPTVFEDIYLRRTTKLPQETLGFITVHTELESIFIKTLELPWKENKLFISCIPVGTYPWEKWYSPSFERVVIRLKGVLGRSDILIHPANYVRELEGCIAPGLTTRDIDGDGLLDTYKSIEALENLVDMLPEKGFIHIA